MKVNAFVPIWVLFICWTQTVVAFEARCRDHAASNNEHASPAAARFFHDYYRGKSSHNATIWGSFFHPTTAVYSDSTLGQTFPNRSSLDAAFRYVTSLFKPGAKAYPLIVLGDTESAVVYSVDEPGLFGQEIRILSVFGFLGGKIRRSTDYWDGRRNIVTNGRPSIDQYPYDLGASQVSDTSNPVMRRVVRQLSSAFAREDANASAALFSSDATLVDLTLRTRIEGRFAIASYLQRALSKVPYGSGSTLRRILGTAQGGGYEWKTDRKDVFNGVTALILNECGAITQLLTVWDASRVGDAEVLALAALSIEP